jgi:site-specific DNA-methyltransferase (adenine-specific)
MSELPDDSIDLVLCDLPYGVTNRNKWDSIIPLDKLWEQYYRIAKQKAAIVLTATQPFASLLVSSNWKHFKYEWIWEKDNGTGFLNAKIQPLRKHEQVLVFYRSQPTYNPQMTDGKPYSITSGRDSTNYGDYHPVLTENDGKRYPTSVLKIQRDKDKFHPTQKPLALMEYLIKTYSNPDDLILDNCSGSGTTALACINTKRRFICIEQDEEFYKDSLSRIANA